MSQIVPLKIADSGCFQRRLEPMIVAKNRASRDAADYGRSALCALATTVANESLRAHRCSVGRAPDHHSSCGAHPARFAPNQSSHKLHRTGYLASAVFVLHGRPRLCVYPFDPLSARCGSYEGSAKHCVSRATLSSLNSMMLMVKDGLPSYVRMNSVIQRSPPPMIRRTANGFLLG